MYDYDAPEYVPGPYVEIWEGDDMIHEVERVWGWSDSWEIVKVDGIPWENVSDDTRAAVQEYLTLKDI